MKPFHEMTADEIAAYNGPTFRATVHWHGVGGKVVESDQEAPSMLHLSQQIGTVARWVTEQGFTPGVTYGPHTDTRRIERDSTRYVHPKATK